MNNNIKYSDGSLEFFRSLFFINRARQFQLWLAAFLFLLTQWASWAGTWTALIHSPPEAINTMLLLPDGTVMAAGANTQSLWYRLTPDASGSYVNGTWTTLAAMHDTRLYFSSQVLTNGRVLVAGGEYGTGTTNSEVYDPVNNTWTTVPLPAGLITMNNVPDASTGQNSAGFLDSGSEMLPNGNVLIAPVFPVNYGGTVIYNVSANSWQAGPTLYRGFYQDEASWVKLADQSILTIDPFGTNSERYIPALNQWVNDANVPVQLYDPYGSELGAAFLLPDGRAFYLGSTGKTALYTPSGSSSPGSWVAGPVIPNAQGTPDAPAAMMVNGVVLCAVSPVPTSANHFPTPVSFYEYDPVANAFTQVNGPTGTTYPSSTYTMRMLDLPDGTVLFSTSDSQLYVYQPSGSPLAAGQPTITGLTANAGGSFHLTGFLFNGISGGAAYGDDAQMNSNYPLIRMTNGLGAVFYARTFNWSNTGVQTGSNPVSTDFTVPAGLVAGTYSLVVVANGNASAPVTFSYAPDGLLVTPASGFAAVGPSGGPFSMVTTNFALTNLGSATFNWSLINTSLWLSAYTSGGSLTPGGLAAVVTVGLNSVASNLVNGVYSASLLFSNQTTQVVQARQFTLQVTSELVQNGGFETGDFTGWTQSGNTGSTAFTMVTSNSSYVHSGSFGMQTGPASSLLYLSQNLDTVPGRNYVVSCWLRNSTGSTPAQFEAVWGGNTLLNLTNPAAFGWTNLVFIATANSSSTLLQFGFRDDPSYLGFDDVSVVPLPPTVLQSLSPSNNQFGFTWNSISGLRYQLQYKTNLTQTGWINLGSPLQAAGSVLSTTDTPGTDTHRFYRLLVLP